MAWGRLAWLLERRGLAIHSVGHWLDAPADVPTVLSNPGLSLYDVAIIHDAPGLGIRVWSALVPDDALRSYVEQGLREHRFEGGGPERIDTAVSFIDVGDRDRPGLPSITIMVNVSGPSLPLSEESIVRHAEAVVCSYSAGAWELWQDRLWDGRAGLERRTLPSRDSLIRGWALCTLQAYAGLTLRDAMHAWRGSRVPDQLHLRVGIGALMGREDQASREWHRARSAANKLQAYLGGSWALTAN